MWDILIDDWNDLLSNQYNKIQLSDLVKRKYYIKLIKSKIRFHKELLHVVPRWKNYVNLKSNIKYLSRNRNSLIYLSEIKYLPEVRFVKIFMKNAITFVLRLKKQDLSFLSLICATWSVMTLFYFSEIRLGDGFY